MQPDTRRFALIGAAGYIAPRHMKAIKEVGGELAAALDPNDSVGVLDTYFPDAHFFTEFERFDRHLDKVRRAEQHSVDYVSICSPNYLHASHVRFALRSRADTICEKPLVLNPWNLDGLGQISARQAAKGGYEGAISSVRFGLRGRFQPGLKKSCSAADASRSTGAPSGHFDALAVNGL